MNHTRSHQHYLSEIEDPQLREKLENKYASLETYKKLQVEAIREAQRASARATMAQAQAQLEEIEFIIAAGEAFDLIATEPNWLTRRNSRGQVLLECLLTQTDIQTIARAQAGEIRKQVRQNLDDDDANSMFKAD
jgi:hypothetical protein